MRRSSAWNLSSRKAVVVLFLGSCFFFTSPFQFLPLLASSLTSPFLKYPSVSAALATPGVSQTGLGAEAFAAVSLLEQFEVDGFQLGRYFTKDPLLLQRVTEGAYPRRLNPKAHFQVLTINELTPSGCALHSQKGNVVLAFCR